MRDWFKKWHRHTDGYDPVGKSEQYGKEHHARQEIRKAVFADPFSDSTRRTRRSLLMLSVFALIANARLPIENIPYFGQPPSEEGLTAVLGVISIGIVYFLVMFVVSAGHEYSRWRLDGNFNVLVRSLDWVQAINDMAFQVKQQIDTRSSTQKSSNLAKFVEDATEKLPDIQTRIERTANHYVSTSRLHMARLVILEIVLPLIVAFFALSKVIALFWPMILRIVSA